MLDVGREQFHCDGKQDDAKHFLQHRDSTFPEEAFEPAQIPEHEVDQHHVDDDGNGIADGSELSAYQLMSEAGAVTLTNSSGRTYKHSSTTHWDAVAAVKAGDGFQVLLEGTGSSVSYTHLRAHETS